MNAATGTLILDGLTALLNLTVRLIEARGQAAPGMARADEGEVQAREELDASAAALTDAIERARRQLEEGQP